MDFDLDDFTKKVKDIYEQNKNCIVAVSEGIHDKDGTFIAEYANKNMAKDSFGHAQLGGLAAFLANHVKQATGAKVRGIELSLLQRCAAHCASQDRHRRILHGRQAAVENAVNGVTDKMVGFEREMVDGKYTCKVKLFDLSIVANTEKKVPRQWINNEGDGITDGFIDYGSAPHSGPDQDDRRRRPAPLRAPEEGQGRGVRLPENKGSRISGGLFACAA